MDVNKMYFKKPTQVKYYNYVGDFDENTPDKEKYKEGIAYNGEVICACCGTVIPLSTILYNVLLQERFILIPFPAITITALIFFIFTHNCI